MDQDKQQTNLNNIFDGITVWRNEGQRAPHKPLLILYALGHLYQKGSRWIPYQNVDRDLKVFLKQFGPYRKNYHPEYPFWRLQNDKLLQSDSSLQNDKLSQNNKLLQNDKIWELKNIESITNLTTSKDVKKSDLIKYGVSGGFSETIFELLSSNPKLGTEIVQRILNANFPSSIHEDILQTMNLDFVEELPRKSRKRDSSFRDRILKAYQYQCAVCGFNVRVGDSLVGLEAAHIQWHQAKGPDQEQNGIALCSLHHKLFDRGAFTIDRSRKIQVSDLAHGTHGFQEWLMKFHDKTILLPQSPSYYPKNDFLVWHVREVFQGDQRAILQAKNAYLPDDDYGVQKGSMG